MSVLTAALIVIALERACAPSAQQQRPTATVGTSWVQVYARPQGAHDGFSRDLSGVTGILVSAGFMPVCSVGSSGERMAVTANNIRIAGPHWGAPFVVRLRGGVQGVDSTWRARETGVAKTKRQARVERGKKLKTIMGGSTRQGRHRKKLPLQNQTFKSEWHRERALQQAARRKARKWARKQANVTSASTPSLAPPLASRQDASRQDAVAGQSSALPAGPEQASVVGAVANETGRGRRGEQDSEAAMESVPSSFLAEMQRQEAKGADGSDSDVVVLDGDGNKIEAPSMSYVPGMPDPSSIHDPFHYIAPDAPLRPYMDAQGNIKWIDRRSPNSKQHDGKTLLVCQLEHMRGGGSVKPQDAHLEMEMAWYGAAARHVRPTDVQRQKEEERRRMWGYEEGQVAALARKVVCTNAISLSSPAISLSHVPCASPACVRSLAHQFMGVLDHRCSWLGRSSRCAFCNGGCARGGSR